MSAFSHSDFEQANAALTREERIRRLVRAQMTDERGISQDVVIRNTSDRGLGITAREFSPVLGEVITVSIPGNGDLTGTVRWVYGQTFGVELDQNLDLRALSNAMSRNVQRSQQQGAWQVRTGHQVRTTKVDPSRLRTL